LSTKARKYTEDQEQEMKVLYEACETNEERDEVVLDLADRYAKNKRMITAKLAKMQIYVKKERISKVTNTTPETKASMVSRLEAKHSWPAGDYAGLEKAPKIVLQKLLNEFKT
jgi:hypothetical protein